MARFDVYANPGRHMATTPYLLDVQSDLLDGLGSRMVIPSRSLKHFPSVKLSTRLTPIFTIKDERFLLETPKMGAVAQGVLNSRVDSLAESKDREKLAALCSLFCGLLGAFSCFRSTFDRAGLCCLHGECNTWQAAWE